MSPCSPCTELLSIKGTSDTKRLIPDEAATALIRAAAAVSSASGLNAIVALSLSAISGSIFCTVGPTSAQCPI